MVIDADMAGLEMKHALITGATGFIGTHLTRVLQQNGWRVTVLIRAGTLERVGFIAPPGAEVAVYDGSASSVIASVTNSRPSVVFHLASMISAHHSLDQIESMIQANVLFGTQLLEAMRTNGINCLVNTGTFWQHYQGARYNPSTLYASTKQAFEAIIEYYREATNIRIVTLMLYDTYGPADPRPKVLTYLLRHLKSGEPLAMSPGDQMLDLIHIDDLCSAYLLAARLLTEKHPTLERTYSIASGRLLSLKQIVALLEQLSGRCLNIEWGAVPYRPREVMVPWIGARLPGWRPEVSLESGFRPLIETMLTG